MHTRHDEILHITEHEDHTQIRVLKTCDIRWSTDTVTWCAMGPYGAGPEVADYDATATKPRSYMAMVDHGRSWLTYYHRDAAMAFADLMEPWFPREKRREHGGHQ